MRTTTTNLKKVFNWINNPCYCIFPDNYLQDWTDNKVKIPYVFDVPDLVAIMSGGYTFKTNSSLEFDKVERYVNIMQIFGFDKLRYCFVFLCKDTITNTKLRYCFWVFFWFCVQG